MTMLLGHFLQAINVRINPNRAQLGPINDDSHLFKEVIHILIPLEFNGMRGRAHKLDQLRLVVGQVQGLQNLREILVLCFWVRLQDINI